MTVAPLVIQFIAGTKLRREAPFSTGLPIIGNGPPGTFVVFPGGREVPLPTDQLVPTGTTDDEGGAVRVGFGGMRFEGIEGGQLVFRRVKEIRPESELSPERRRRMTLDPWMVAALFVDGDHAWPPPPSLH